MKLHIKIINLLLKFINFDAKYVIDTKNTISMAYSENKILTPTTRDRERIAKVQFACQRFRVSLSYPTFGTCTIIVSQAENACRISYQFDYEDTPER